MLRAGVNDAGSSAPLAARTQSRGQGWLYRFATLTAVGALSGCGLVGGGLQGMVVDNYTGEVVWLNLEDGNQEPGEPTGLRASGYVLQRYSEDFGLGAPSPVLVDGDSVYVDASTDRYSAIERGSRGGTEVVPVFTTGGSITQAVLLDNEKLALSEVIDSTETCYLIEGDAQPRVVASGDDCSFSEDFSQVVEVLRAGEVSDVRVLSLEGEILYEFTAFGLGPSEDVVFSPRFSYFGYVETPGGNPEAGELGADTTDGSVEPDTEGLTSSALPSTGYLVGAEGQEVGATIPLANLEVRVRGGGIVFEGDVDGETHLYASSDNQLHPMGQGESGWVGTSSDGSAAVGIIQRDGSGQVVWVKSGADPSVVSDRIPMDNDSTRIALSGNIVFLSTGLGRSTLLTVDMMSGSVTPLEGVTPGGPISYVMPVLEDSFFIAAESPSSGQEAFLANVADGTISAIGRLDGRPIGQVGSRVLLSNGDSVTTLDLEAPTRPSVLLRGSLISEDLLFTRDDALFATRLAASAGTGSSMDFVETEIVRAPLDENVRETILRSYAMLASLEGASQVARPRVSEAEFLRLSISRSASDLQQEAAADLGCVGDVQVFPDLAAQGQVTLAPSQCFFTTFSGTLNVTVRAALMTPEANPYLRVYGLPVDSSSPYELTCADSVNADFSNCRSPIDVFGPGDGAGMFIVNKSADTAVVDLFAVS